MTGVPDKARLPVALLAAALGFTLLFTGVVFHFWAQISLTVVVRVLPGEPVNSLTQHGRRAQRITLEHVRRDAGGCIHSVQQYAHPVHPSPGEGRFLERSGECRPARTAGTSDHCASRTAYAEISPPGAIPAIESASVDKG